MVDFDLLLNHLRKVKIMTVTKEEAFEIERRDPGGYVFDVTIHKNGTFEAKLIGNPEEYMVYLSIV